MERKVSDRLKEEKEKLNLKWVGLLSNFILIGIIALHTMDYFYSDMIDTPIIIYEVYTFSLIITIRFFPGILSKYYLGMAILWNVDLICIYCAFCKYKKYASAFVSFSTLVMINGQMELAFTRFQGYLAITVDYLLWILASSQLGVLLDPVPIQILYLIIVNLLLKFFTFDHRLNTATEDLKIKIELENTECNLKSLLHAMQEGIMVFNSNFKVKMVNSAYRNLFSNWEVENFFLSSVEIHDSSSSVKLLQNEIDIFWKSNKTETVFGLISKDSKKIECTGTKVQWDCELSLVLTFRDVSTLYNLLQEKNQISETLNTLRNLSHELKTPLNTIINSHLDVLHRTSLSKKTEKILKSSLSASYVLLFMLRDILDYSYIKMNCFQMNLEKVDLKALLHDSINILSKLYNMASVTIFIQEDLPNEIFIDRSRLQQLFINIVSCSLQMNHLGKIDIKLLKKHRKVKFSAQFACKTTRNIEKSYSNLSIFTSLRLKIAKEIVKKITSQSLKLLENGQKVKIGFCIDLANKEYQKSFELENPDIINSFFSSFDNFIDILIVDDIEMNLLVLKRLIEMLDKNCPCANRHPNYSIELASSGIEAIRKVVEKAKSESGYRLIIMDCQMPDMDGWKATEELFKLKEKKVLLYEPKVVAYSAFDSSIDLERCKDVGMKSHVSKPCTPEALCKLLRRFLPH